MATDGARHRTNPLPSHSMNASAPSPSAAAAQPWLALYAAGQPHSITPQFSHMLAMLAHALATQPDAPFIRYFDGVLSLREANAAADALAAELQARGFAPGDRLALYTQNNPGFVIGLLAAWKAGGTGVSVNPMNKQRELRYILENSGAQALLCLDDLYVDVVTPMLADLRADASPLPLQTVVTTSALDWQTRGDLRVLPHAQRLPVPHGVLDLLAVSRSGATPKPLASAPTAEDVALLTYTSGTTGQPKGAMNTHGNLTFTAEPVRNFVCEA